MSVVKLLICEICIVIILTNQSNARSHSRHTVLPSSEEMVESKNSSTSVRYSFENSSFSAYLKPARNVVERVINVLPSPKQILNYGKQTLIGIPQEIAANAKRFLCSKAVHLNDIQKEFYPELENLNYLFLTDDRDNVTISLSNSEYLFNHPKFHMNWNVVLFVSGWDLNMNQTNQTILALYEAYKCRSGYNFVVLDTSKFVNSMYAWSELSTEPLGELVGDSIADLTRFIPYDRFHVIGHGIGSHIAGFAGRHFTKKFAKALLRITGIDPSRPCFSEFDRANGLQRGDALFVDIIHSNSEFLRSDPIGDIDFYTNGPKIVQTGCWSISCATVMAYQFYAETVYPGNEFLFNATKCESSGLFTLGNCRSAENEQLTIPFGFATPIWARGKFYLTSTLVQNRLKKHCINY